MSTLSIFIEISPKRNDIDFYYKFKCIDLLLINIGVCYSNFI